jgi:predicted nucleotidyltransferase
MGRLDQFDPRWKSITESGMAGWWFERGSLAEVADVLAQSYLERARQGTGPGLRLADRGMPMLEASVAATAAVREGLGVEAAAERARVLLDPYEADIRCAEAGEFSVLLLHDRDPAAGTASSLAREASVTPIYAGYQRQLHEQLTRLEAQGRFAGSVVTAGRSILEVQAHVRSELPDCGVVVPPCRLPEVTVVAFGGMSESGKSTAAEYLRETHGFARLKIGYLLDLAAGLHGIADPYAVGAVTQAELLADALDRYCAAHHFLDRVTIESLHRYEPAGELRKLLGNRLHMMYLRTSAPVRERRAAEDIAELRARDEVKRGRGADKIASIADEVLGNDRDRLALYRSLDRFVCRMRWPLRRPAVVTVGMLGLPVHLESFLSSFLDKLTTQVAGIDLVAVTGSGARGKYQHGWSDLDVLVIASTGAVPGLKDVLDGLRADLAGVKLGITVVTAGECAAGVVTPRLLHVLNRYLRVTPGGLLRIDAGKAKAEENLDGKYLLRTSDPKMTAEDIALGYRQLLEVERGWRDMKQVIDLRPVYHRKEERIRAHVILCWLALLLARVAENTCGATWPELRRQLDRIAVGTFAGPAGTFRQRTEITGAQAAILDRLQIDPPPKIYQLTPATNR